jgi:hypothetical protein
LADHDPKQTVSGHGFIGAHEDRLGRRITSRLIYSFIARVHCRPNRYSSGSIPTTIDAAGDRIFVRSWP